MTKHGHAFWIDDSWTLILFGYSPMCVRVSVVLWAKTHQINKNPLCKWALAHNNKFFFQGHLSFCTQSFKITKRFFFSLKKDERKNPTNTHTTNGHNKSEKRYFKFKNDFSIKISTRMVVNWIVTIDITFVTLLIIQSLRLQLGS